MAGPRSRTALMRAVQLIGVAATVGYMLLVGWAWTHSAYDVSGALMVVPALLLVNVHLVMRAGRADPDPRFLRLLAAALVLKLVAIVARYLMTYVLYGGVGDAPVYDTEGARLAESYREGVFGAEIGRDFIGTGFVRVLTGVLYSVTGPSVYVAYAFFGTLSFWGLYFLYVAFRTGVPDGDHRRYALLVLFLPSMLFWPSGLGKEAWMIFGIGLTAMGAARLLADNRHWALPLVAGLTATAMVRPHITAALFAGIALAVVLRRSSKPATPLTPLARGFAIAAVVVAGVVVVGRAASFLGVEDVSVDGVDSAIDSTADQTSSGGSEFDPAVVNSPLDMPWATVSVLFRPFVFEADNVAALLAAAEGAALLGLIVLSLPRIRAAWDRLTRRPYLIMCLTYSILFVYAFSHFSNFGILTRQRVQVLPFVLVLLALPLLSRGSQRRSAHPTHQEVSP